MQLLYNNYYKLYGIRRVQQLVAPRLFPMETFFFPRSATYHFVSHDDTTLNPDPTQSFLSSYTKRIMMDVVSDLTEHKGNARKIASPINVLTRPFLMKHRQFKVMPNAASMIHDPATLTIVDYAYLQKLYRYTQTPLLSYYKWFNIEKTVWDTVLKLSNESERQNFVFVDLPDVLPSVSSLRMYTQRLTNAIIHVFDSPAKHFILELWRWIGDEARETSLFGQFKQENLDKVNLVFSHNGKWCVLNMGQFNRWRKINKDEVTDDGVTTGISYSPLQLQKLMLKFFISIQSQTAIVEADITEQPTATTPEDHQPGVDDEDDDEIDDDERQPELSDPKPETLPPLKENTGRPVEVHEETIPDLFDGELNDDVFKSIEEDLKALEYIEKKTLMVRGVNNAVDTTNLIAPEKVNLTFEASTDDIENIHGKIFTDYEPEEALKKAIDKHVEYGLMTAADYRNTLKQADAFMQKPAPYQEDQSIKEFIKISQEDLAIQPIDIQMPDIKTVLDKSMLESSLNVFDSKYIKTVLPKDVTAMATNIQKAGVIIQDYAIETDASALGEYEVHTLKIKPIDGVVSTVRFKLPKVDEEGNFIANGNKYHMRKQRSDLPIRKIRPDTVALTSYYGKVFVSRSAKRANNSIEWLVKQLTSLGQTGESELIKRVAPANVFDNGFKAPRIYSGLAQHFKSVKVGEYNFNFDWTERKTHFAEPTTGEKSLSADAQANALEGNKYRICGNTDNGELILVDYNDEFFVLRGQEPVAIGDIYSICLLDRTKAPVDFAEVKIFAKTIPVGIVLAYMLGFTNLIKYLGEKPRIFEPRQRVDLKSDEYVIAFKDKKFVFSRKNVKAALILGGFNEYDRTLKNYFVESFDKPNVYLNVLESNGIGARFLRELEMLDNLFIDPITRDILIEMKEPTTFKGLILRSCEMLTDDMHPDSQDMRAMRIKGYERFAGAVYKELILSLREFKARNIRGKSQIDLNPYAIWRNITQDPSVEIVKDINPIENLKQVEAVTYVGEGGRAKDAMTKASRAYHKSDFGVVSEATVDSSDVGINAFLSANPLFSSLRGLTKEFDEQKHGYSSVLSTSAIISPGADHDDPKRVNFISIQQSHTIACEGYHQPHLRTGYEQVLAHRTGELFAYTAKEAGKVISRNEKGLIVEFKSGDKRGFKLGRQYGRAEGSVYPHDIASGLAVGDEFQVGQTIVYNTGFFEPDFLNPKNAVWKSSLAVKTALYESTQTHEDSSSVSKRVSQALTAKTTKVRSFVVTFEQGVKNIMKAGSTVEPSDVLFVIEEAVTNEHGLFDEATLATLQKIANNAPLAKVRGTIDRMEVYYHGNKEDMSPSLRTLVNQSDKQMADEAKAIGKPVITGAVTEEYRVAGTPLAMDSAEIKVYITIETNAGVGDKGVFANQMKSVFGEVLDYDMTTEEGEPIDAVFGRRSIAARIVLSPDIIGTSTTLLKVIAKKAVQIFKG